MENRGSGLGCIVTGLGIVLVIFLLPYLVSSVYSVANAMWQAGGSANWLWGDWVNTWTKGDRTLYIMLSEGPMCCVGALALLILIVGVVAIVSDRDEDEEHNEADDFGAHAEEDEEDAHEGDQGLHGDAYAGGSGFRQDADGSA